MRDSPKLLKTLVIVAALADSAAVASATDLPARIYNKAVRDWLTPGRWSVKSEYLYVDLGISSDNYILNGFNTRLRPTSRTIFSAPA